MKRDLYYVVVPQRTFFDLARRYGFELIVEDGYVWRTPYHDRGVGKETSREQLIAATWQAFVGGFDFTRLRGAEAEAAQQFLRECLKLGPEGCWNVSEYEGGEARDLLSDAQSLAVRAHANLKALAST